MIVYLVMIALIVILGLQDNRAYFTPLAYSNNECDKKKRTNLFYILLIVLFLVVGGFRYYIGTDFGAYYKISPESLTVVLKKFYALDEPGISFLAYVVRMIWDEGIFLIFIENAIITLLVFKGLRRHDMSDYTIPLLLYVFYCGWLFSLNGVRQAIAVSIIFAYSGKSEKHWLLKYFFIVFLAFLFHRSALFMLPILILANRKIDFKQVILVLLFAVIIPYMGDFAMNYMGVTDLSGEYTTREINPLRIAVSFAPLLLIGLLYLKKNFHFFEKYYFVTNMVIINAVLTLFTANSAYMNRFSRFTVLYTVVFIPKFTERLTNKSRKFFNIMVVLLYFIYFLYEISSSGNYLPFQWSFGHFGEF